MVKIMVVEDNERVASSVKKGLASQGYLVNVFGDAESAIKEAKSVDYDLLLIDIMLPRMNGIELSKQMRAAYPRIPIIMLTALGSIDEKISGFDAGADDYMVKPFEIRELYARIKAILLRKPIAHSKKEESNILEYQDLTINKNTNRVFRNGIEIELTPKEFKLLSFLMSNTERILTREEIAENVWGNHFDTGTNYIDVYIAYLRKKIDKNFDEKLIHTKPGVGFIFTRLA